MPGSTHRSPSTFPSARPIIVPSAVLTAGPLDFSTALPTALRAVLAATIAVLMLATGAAATDPLGGTGGGPIAGSLQVQVVEAGTGAPIAGAFVLAGPRPGEPFAGNWALADGNGTVLFSDAALSGPVTVTAGAAGHSWFTLASVNAADLVLPLRPDPAPSSPVQIGDYVSGIDVNNGSYHLGDGYVDMALVLPALRLEELAAFDLAGLMGPPEIISILGQEFEVPSNLFIPQQWELLTEINKDHWYLYPEPGSYTLAALSGRISRDALLSGGDITQLLPLLDWKEIDIREAVVTGPGNDFDLTVDPDLVPTVTLNLGNVPDNSTAWCISVGDLDGQEGLGRLLPLGFNSLECPSGSGPCSGAVTLTTTAAAGEFAGMTYFPAVVVETVGALDRLALMSRAPHPQTYTEAMSSFFRVIDLSYRGGNFSWTDAANPAAGSPPVHVQGMRITEAATGRLLWEVLAPGGALSFDTPGLPQEAPAGPDWGASCRWSHLSYGLGHDLPAFDFDAFAFSDLTAHTSHFAADELEFPWLGDPAGTPEIAAVPLGGWAPTPFARSTALRFDLPQAGPASLVIYDLEGRRVAEPASGMLAAGAHRAVWDGRDASGRLLPNGFYFARLTATGLEQSWKLVLRR